MNINEQVADTIEKHRMLGQGDKVLIALSGGPDSTCLMHVLAALSDAMELELSAHYVDHGLRPDETPAEIARCQELCSALKIPFTHSSVDVHAKVTGNGGGNLQEAARELRYNALAEAAVSVGARRIALGHTLDDQAETFFMRILRGAGPSGLAGIPPVRGGLIRPLIQIRKTTILGYLKDKGIEPVLDSSNLKDTYLRNQLRKDLMPMLEDINPSIIETVGRTTEILADEERYFFIQVNKAMMRMITSKGDDHIELFLRPFESLDLTIARRVLRRAVEETLSLRKLTHTHIDEILTLLKKGHPGHSIDLPHGIKVIKKYSTFLITSAPPVKIETRTMETPGTLEIPEARMKLVATVLDNPPSPTKNQRLCALDADKATFPLTVRSRMDGDSFHPLGLGGKTKKIQDFFVDEKIPRYERDAVPIVCVGDEIAWIAGHRADERYAPSEQTRRLLLLELKG